MLNGHDKSVAVKEWVWPKRAKQHASPLVNTHTPIVQIHILKCIFMLCITHNYNTCIKRERYLCAAFPQWNLRERHSTPGVSDAFTTEQLLHLCPYPLTSLLWPTHSCVLISAMNTLHHPALFSFSLPTVRGGVHFQVIWIPARGVETGRFNCTCQILSCYLIPSVTVGVPMQPCWKHSNRSLRGFQNRRIQWCFEDPTSRAQQP